MKKATIEVSNEAKARIEDYHTNGIDSRLNELNEVREYLLNQWLNGELCEDYAKRLLGTIIEAKHLYNALADHPNEAI